MDNQNTTIKSVRPERFNVLILVLMDNQNTSFVLAMVITTQS